MPLGIKLRLHDSSGAVLANQTDIEAMWWDVDVVDALDHPIGKTTGASTDASGDLVIDLSGVSGLAIGDYGFLVLYQANSTDHRDSPAFIGKLQTENVTGGVALAHNSNWVRPQTWPALSSTVGNNTFSGLHAVFPIGPNWCAFSFSISSGRYLVDWGDTSADSAVDSTVAVYKSYAYADCPDNDVGKENAVGCVLTDAGDTVDITGHDFVNGELISFSEITSTTGLSVGSLYYVVNASSNTFQVADAIGGSAKALTTNGSGKVYRPLYRTVVVDVVPETGGSDITALDLAVRHQSASDVSYSTQWLDISINAQNATDVVIGGSANVMHRMLQQASADVRSVSNLASLFSGCRGLRSLPALNTASGANFNSTFLGCFSLTAIPLLNTALGTNFSAMFYNCYALGSVPLLDTALGVDFSFMFCGCQRLENIAPIDTSAGTNFSSTFRNCFSVERIPLIDTSSGTNFSSMFQACQALQDIPLLDTSLGTNFSSMFNQCYTLKNIPALDTSLGTTFASMFTGCSSLQSGRMNGTKENITYPACQLSGSSLDEIYRGLATVSGKTITVTGNYGTATDDPTIATAKGWTVTS